MAFKLMRNARLESFVARATKPSLVLNRIIPLAYGIYLAGFSISAAVRLAGQRPKLEDAIMSDLLSPEYNPRGCYISAVAAAFCGFMLLPSVGLFIRTWRTLGTRWGEVGAWLYGLGLLSVIATAVSAPFQMPYVPIHIYLAFIAFMSLVAGLGISLTAAVFVSHAARLKFAVAAVVLLGAFIYLIYLFFAPEYFAGRRWLLALLEWALGALIGIGTVLVTMVAVECENRCLKSSAEALPKKTQPAA